jgi:hypothetical protein
MWQLIGQRRMGLNAVGIKTTDIAAKAKSIVIQINIKLFRK